MAYWLIRANLLPEPMSTCKLDTQEHTLVNLIAVQTSLFKKMHLKVLFAKWWPLCLSLSVLIKAMSPCYYDYPYQI